jgi:hypothetical protein
MADLKGRLAGVMHLVGLVVRRMICGPLQLHIFCTHEDDPLISCFLSNSRAQLIKRRRPRTGRTLRTSNLARYLHREDSLPPRCGSFGAVDAFTRNVSIKLGIICHRRVQHFDGLQSVGEHDWRVARKHRCEVSEESQPSHRSSMSRGV